MMGRTGHIIAEPHADAYQIHIHGTHLGERMERFVRICS